MAQIGLRENPKFRRLVKRLGLPAPFVVGLLETMWHVGYQTASAKLGDAEDVECAAEWPGRKGTFFKAIKKDWLDEENGVYFIHHLFENAPEFIRKRINRRRRGSESSSIQENENDAASNDKDLGEEMDATRRHETLPTAPSNPTRPDQTQPIDSNPTPTGTPTAPANGSGSGLKSGGDGGGSGRLFDSDAARQLEVQGLLAQAGVNTTMQQRLMQNRTITPTLIRRHLDDIEGDKSIDRPAAVLVSRLQKKG